MTAFANWAGRWFGREQMAREIAALSDREVHDLGMDRSELLAMAQVPRKLRERMETMALVFGVDPSEVYASRGRNVDLVKTCSQCTDLERCAAELSSPANTGPERCDFCPNSAAFREIAATRVAA